MHSVSFSLQAYQTSYLMTIQSGYDQWNSTDFGHLSFDIVVASQCFDKEETFFGQFLVIIVMNHNFHHKLETPKLHYPLAKFVANC